MTEKCGRSSPEKKLGNKCKANGNGAGNMSGTDKDTASIKEKVLAETSNLQTTLIEALPYPTMLIRKDRTVLFANKVARQIGAVVGGQCWRDFGQSDYIPDEDKAYINQHKEKPPHGTYCTFCLADVALANSKDAIAPEIHAFGKIWEAHWIPVSKDAYLHYVHDITERKKVEESLRQSEERLRLAQASANVGIWDWNVQTGQLNWTKELEALYGYVPGTFPHNYAGFSDHVHPDDLADVEARRDEAVAAHRPFDLEFRILLPSGMVRWANVKGAAKYDETGAPLHVYGVHSDITERKQAEERIKSSLKEKELLLKEIYHRTKNNFQVISSMLYLQSEYAGDKKVSDILDKCYDRVKSMAAVHEYLYKSEDFTHIDFAEYVRDLLASLYHSYGISEKTIAFQINIDNIFLGLDMAVPCGLIINELISNSLKHAFGRLKKRDRENAKICVDMHKTDDCKLVLIVDDNGSGLAGDLNSMSGQTFGLYLIKNLAKQLDGAIELNTDNGTKFTITFPYDME